jgi:hydrogenase expression/formation protein HypE
MTTRLLELGAAPAAARRLGRVHGKTVTLAHGGGGKAMKDLVDDVFVRAFGEASPGPLEDQARLDLADLCRHGDRLAFTTDSFVVHPLFFPGGDIGKLAVCGTVNDLAVGGAVPLYLSCAAILEEGVPVELVRRVALSMAQTAREAGVQIVTGDTKVVEHGACDKLFLTTTGVGIIPRGIALSVAAARPGDVVLVNGMLGDHGAAILAARGDLQIDTPIESDCAALHGLVAALLAAAPGTRAIRDATRGGVATVLNELAEASDVEIEIDDERTPLRREVRGFCEILGLDPLYLANEGKLVAVVPPAEADAALAALRGHALGRDAVGIGIVRDGRGGRVIMRTFTGGHRIVDMLVGEQLPRIC